MAGCCSSGVEHFLGKEEVEGSIPFNSSRFWIDAFIPKTIGIEMMTLK
jgi:hypothetical protein